MMCHLLLFIKNETQIFHFNSSPAGATHFTRCKTGAGALLPAPGNLKSMDQNHACMFMFTLHTFMCNIDCLWEEPFCKRIGHSTCRIRSKFVSGVWCVVCDVC